MPPLARILRALIVLLVAASAALGISNAALAQDSDDRTVEILQVSGPLDPPVVGAIRDVVEGANERGSELVVVQVHLTSGIAVSPEEVIDLVRRSAVPVVVWVGPGAARAAGAGALFAGLGHVAAVAPGASLGPACPIEASTRCAGESDRQAVADLLSDAAGLSDTAAGALAATIVDAERAVALGIADLSAAGLEPLLVELDGREVATAAGPRTLRVRADEVTIRFHSLGLLRRILHATLDPALVYLVLASVLLLLLFEVFQPGFGVAGVAALLLAPLAVYGLAVLPTAWWAVALLVVGMLLLAVDLAIAGLGAPTALGAAGVAAGSWWLFPSGGPGLRLSAWLVGIVTLASVVFFVFVMTLVLRAQAGPEVDEVGEELVGRVGVVRSTLNPEGHVFVGGALWRARWTSARRGRLRTGSRVRIHGIDDEGVLLAEEAEHEAVGAPDDL
ncbi:MAG: NfeD family protein [Nitriliruptorales bacterium]